MATKRKIEAVFSAPRGRWKVDVPASISKTGKRFKAWFKTREEARNYAAKLADSEAPSPAIAPDLALDADKARAILDPWGLDLVQAAREMVAALEALGDAGNILEAAKAYRAAHVSRTASKALGEAVALYLDSRADLRNSTITSYTYTLAKLLAPIHKITMADIKTAALASILDPKAATARAMHKRNIRVFWKWASTPPRQWADMATVDALEAVRQSNDSDIAILDPGDVKAIMRAAEEEKPAAAAAYAIAIFGGVRMAELGRLTWGDVGADYIEIGPAIAKKHSRRLVPICPTLRAWIDATRGTAENTDLVTGADWPEVSKSVRRRAGFEVAARRLTAAIAAGRMKKLPQPTRGPWPANACRHTCASVQIAIGTPLDDLTFKFGHSGGHDLLRRHYVARLTKDDAVAILNIGPNGSVIGIDKKTGLVKAAKAGAVKTAGKKAKPRGRNQA